MVFSRESSPVHRLLLCLCWFLSCLTFAWADWPQFRGPSGNSVVTSQDIPTTWGGVFDVPAWKCDLPGRGWSSPIVIGNRIWLTSAVESLLDEKSALEKLASRPYGVEDFQTHASVQLLAVELDRASGQLLRRIDLFETPNPNPIHALNSYATPTPCSDGKRLVCHFGALGTACLDIASGEVLWRTAFPMEDITGGGPSPVTDGRHVFLTCDGADQQFVISIDIESGAIQWKTHRPAIDVSDPSHYRSFSTPVLIQHEGKKQLVSMAAQWLVAYEPDSGREIWKARITDGYAAVPSLAYENGIVFACTGFWKHELVAVRVDGSGDVTNSHIAWRYSKNIPDVCSPVAIDGLLYMVSSIGIATCLDYMNGERIWQKRLGGNHSASPIAVKNQKGEVLLYFTSREGVSTVLRGGRTWVEVSKNDLFGETFASMVPDKGQWLIRTNPTLYCIGSPSNQDGTR
jgi:outer membrane protein assembly factor BamB